MNTNSNVASAIDKLLLCSDRTDIYERGVFVAEYDEMRSWKAVDPMCCYITTPLGRQNKGSSDKNSNKTKKFKPALSVHFYINNNAVEKSNLKSVKLRTRDCLCPKHDNFVDDMLMDDKCNSFRKRTSSLNSKLSKSQNVLSYDVPSWRFIINTKTYNYIDRCHPKDIKKFYNLSPRSHSSLQPDTEMRIIDPALFMDERLTAIYKAYKKYEPNKENQQIISRLQELKKIDNDIKSRLTKMPVASVDGESVNNDETENPKYLNLRSDKLKLSIKTKSKKEKKYLPFKDKKPGNSKHTTTKKKKKKSNKQTKSVKFEQKKQVLPVLRHSVVCPSRLPYLPKLKEVKSMPKKTSNVVYNGRIISHLSLDKKPSDPVIYRTSELYLPTLNYSNYNEFYLPTDSVIPTSTVKLPPISRVSLPLTSSTSSLFL